MFKKIDKLLAVVPLFWLLFGGFGLLYLLIHLTNVTALPVFADEAIYIRWAQLLLDDPKQYAFFSLNDGKTPLFIWLMAPIQYLFSDQLYAGRFVSVVVGLFQLLILMKLAQVITGRKLGVVVTALASIFLPFWFFYHRMALMDGLLSLFISIGVLSTYYLVHQPVNQGADRSNKIWAVWSNVWQELNDILRWSVLKWVLLLGLSLGLAFMTKLPAVLALPSFVFWVFYPEKINLWQRFRLSIRIGIGLILAVLIFSLLKVQPAFGQLFSRGGDFLHPISEILLHGGWLHSILQIPRYIWYLIGNLSLPVMLFSFLPLFFAQTRRKGAVLVLSWLVFLAPMWLFGKVVYPRYFMPSAIFITLGAAVGFILAQDNWVKQAKTIWSQIAAALVIASTVATIAQVSIGFVGAALYFPNRIPFIADDKTQYLTEWSSGHGVKQTADLITLNSTEQKIAVATEGYFGTLPDGLLMYFHRKPVDHIMIEGIGQPVRSIPDSFWQKTVGYDRVWLVVNSHRLMMSIPKDKVLLSECRPEGAPCLQVWDITDLRP